MLNAIASMISPIRWLADTNWKPQWNPGGQPGPAATTPNSTSFPESPNN